MLRAIRLAHRLSFSLAAPTADCLREAVHECYWLTVGSHRLGREIRLLFRENDWPGLCRRLDDWGLFRPFFATVLTATKLAALARVDDAAMLFDRCGLVFERTAVAALILGGRSGDWLDPEDNVRSWTGRLSALGRLLAAPATAGRPAAALRDIPPPVLAYLWIICQNEEERLRLQTMLDRFCRPRPSPDGGGKPRPDPA